MDKVKNKITQHGSPPPVQYGGAGAYSSSNFESPRENPKNQKEKRRFKTERNEQAAALVSTEENDTLEFEDTPERLRRGGSKLKQLVALTTDSAETIELFEEKQHLLKDTFSKVF